MELEEAERLAISRAVASCWAIPGYRERFLADPRGLLLEAGMPLPEVVAVTVLENTPQVTYLTLPEHARALPEGLEQVLRTALPLAPGQQIVLVQNSPRTLHVVIPLAPGSTVSGMQRQMETGLAD